MSSIGASCARCSAVDQVRRRGERLRRRSAASSAGSRCATGEQAPTATRARDASVRVGLDARPPP